MMERRSFLRMLGLAPVVAAAPALARLAPETVGEVVAVTTIRPELIVTGSIQAAKINAGSIALGKLVVTDYSRRWVVDKLPT